jgi:hypothetical protein
MPSRYPRQAGDDSDDDTDEGQATINVALQPSFLESPANVIIIARDANGNLRIMQIKERDSLALNDGDMPNILTIPRAGIDPADVPYWVRDEYGNREESSEAEDKDDGDEASEILGETPGPPQHGESRHHGLDPIVAHSFGSPGSCKTAPGGGLVPLASAKLVYSVIPRPGVLV